MTEQTRPEKNVNLSVNWIFCHLRWGWLVIIVLIVVLNAVTRPLPIYTYYLVGGGVFLNLVILAILFVGWYPDWLNTAVVIVETSLGIGVMIALGGHTAQILPIFIFPVVESVLQLNPETGLLLSAVPVTLAYAASLIIIRDFQVAAIAGVIADLAVLYGSGLITGLIAQEKLRLKGDEDKQIIKQLRVENDRAKAIYEMANTLSSTLNYRNVLNAMVELAQLALAEAGSKENNYATVGMVLLFEEEAPSGRLKMVSGRNIPRPDEGRYVTPKEGLLAQAIYKAEAIIDNNVSEDPVLKSFMALQSCHSMVCAPLRAGFDMYGVVLFANPQYNIYTQEHALLLTTFCNQAIIALQNAQLYADLEREQRKLLEKEAQARRELARNLHDGPTQAIAAMAMRLNFVQMLIKREGNMEKAMDELAKIEQIALKTTQEIRNMLFTLRPVVLETQGLVAALKQYAERLRNVDNLNIELDIDNYNSQLDTQEEGVVFTIIEEAVGNAKKYAEAGVIKIRLVAQSLAGQNGLVIAEVVDNGKGFDVDAVKSTYDQRGSLGLLNMDERAQMVGGRCQLKSTKGKGTSVKIEIPTHQN